MTVSRWNLPLGVPPVGSGGGRGLGHQAGDVGAERVGLRLLGGHVGQDLFALLVGLVLEHGEVRLAIGEPLLQEEVLRLRQPVVAHESRIVIADDGEVAGACEEILQRARADEYLDDSHLGSPVDLDGARGERAARVDQLDLPRRKLGRQFGDLSTRPLELAPQSHVLGDLRVDFELLGFEFGLGGRLLRRLGFDRGRSRGRQRPRRAGAQCQHACQDECRRHQPQTMSHRTTHTASTVGARRTALQRGGPQRPYHAPCCAITAP